MVVDGNETILDKQMAVLRDFNLPITMIIGYEGQMIIDHCKEMGYDVDFVWDKNYHKQYSNVRLINDNSSVFVGDILVLFSDTLFNTDAIEWLLLVDADVAKIYNLYKMTGIGIEAVKDVLRNSNLESLDSQMFFKIEERHPNLKLTRVSPPIWQFDVDRTEELNIARRKYTGDRKL